MTALLAARNQLLGMAAQNKLLAGVRPNGVEDAPQFKLDIDREKAAALGVPLADINQTLSTAWGSSYVNDFLDRGRVKRVYVQGEAFARMQPEDLGSWYVRNTPGEMVPFSAFCQRAAGPRVRRSWCATTACRRSASRGRLRRASVRARRCVPWKTW